MWMPRSSCDCQRSYCVFEEFEEMDQSTTMSNESHEASGEGARELAGVSHGMRAEFQASDECVCADNRQSNGATNHARDL